MPLEVAARTGSLGQQIDSAESRRDEGDVATALRLYMDLATATNTDERTHAFVRDRLATVQVERLLQGGDWVDFLPVGDDLVGWTTERGKCTPLPDGTLEVQSGEGGHLLYSRVRVGNHFEVRGTFEVMRSSPGPFKRAWSLAFRSLTRRNGMLFG